MTDHDPRRFSRWIPAVVWASLIFVGSSIPGTDLPSTGLAPVAHFVEYAVLGGLVIFALGAHRGRLAVLITGIALATLYGIADEIHQSFVPGRTPDSMDVLVDLIGASVGSLLALWVARRAASRKAEL